MQRADEHAVHRARENRDRKRTKERERDAVATTERGITRRETTKVERISVRDGEKAPPRKGEGGGHPRRCLYRSSEIFTLFQRAIAFSPRVDNVAASPGPSPLSLAVSCKCERPLSDKCQLLRRLRWGCPPNSSWIVIQSRPAARPENESSRTTSWAAKRRAATVNDRRSNGAYRGY